MKKFVVVLAAMAMTAGFAAKADDNKQAQCTAPEQCERPCDDRRCDRPCAPAYCPFDELNLTDSQKQQLKELGEKNRKDCLDAKQQCKQAKKEAKQARKEAKKTAKKARLEAIKGILTPEQYVQFLELTFINGGNDRPAAPRHQGDMRRHPGFKGDKRMQKSIPATKIDRAMKVEKAEK